MGKESRAKYLAKNTLIFALGNFGTKIINFFLVPIYTYVLNSAQYGTVDLITTITTVLAPVLILNISESVMRYSLDKDSDQSAISSTGILCLFFGIIIGILVIPISKRFDTISAYSGYLYLYIASLACSQFFLSELRGKEKLLAYSIGNIINTLAIACLNILFLIGMKLGITGYLMAYIAANFITAVYALIVSRTIIDLKNFHVDRELSNEMIKYGVVLVPNTFMWWIMNSSDRVMVTAMISVSANGIYAISYKFPTLLSTVSSIFNQAWGYSAIREDDSADKVEFNNKAFRALSAIVLTSGTIMMLFIRPFLSLYVSEAYYTAWKYTPYLIIGCSFLTLGTFLATQYTVHKDSKGYLFSATVGAILNIVLNYFLIPVMGVSGAALATCISYVAVYIYRIVDTRKYIKLDIINKEIVAGSIILVLSGGSIFVEGLAGYALLIIEIFIIIFVFKETWGTFRRLILRKIIIRK